MNCKSNILIFFLLFAVLGVKAQIADKNAYLGDVKQELQKTWPGNRTVNLVFHGHSVPAGYFVTPDVCTLQAYPFLTLQTVKEYYPYAVVNSITTAIGGENAEQGCTRFVKEVLTHRPDVLFIDYALNDRGLGLERARRAWETMIQEALKLQIKVILMTPTPDLTTDILNPDEPLEKHSQQIRDLAEKYQTGLVDSYAAFKQIREAGVDLRMYMSQFNHPNEKGHRVVCDLIVQWLLNTGAMKPSKVVVNINGDPKSNMGFNWVTNCTATGMVQIAEGITTDFTLSQVVHASSTFLFNGEYLHKAEATGLQPETTYSYRVGNGNDWSDIGKFITVPEGKSDFSRPINRSGCRVWYENRKYHLQSNGRISKISYTNH